MEENSQNHYINEETEPKVTSIDPNERKLARRLRIQRRAEALRRQQMQVGQEIVEEVEKTQVEQQVETSNKDLQTLVSEGLELVTNVRIANDAREVKRREENVVAHQERMAKLDQELVASAQKLEEINARWEGILGTNDPLDLYHDIHHQRVKCSELMSQKDQLIQELRKELHLADDRFMRDQRRQKQDLGLLCERIDQQVVVMGRAYKQELLLVEDAISRERHQLIEAGKKKWEGLYKARDKLELSHMDKKMHTVQQFEQEMYKIHKENEEHYRAKKLQLETDLQVLQQELEQVKALCLLNMEKLDYNYQVLKKRDEENIIMKSQQKRRINKLQDMVNVLRRRIVETERSSSQETTRLTEEVVRLHRNIVDIENKAGHFTQVNDSKYNQLWQLNTDTARALLDKILSADRVIHEQLLGLDWYQPGQPLLHKTDLASYRSAMQVVAELFKDKVNQKAVNSPGAHTVQFQDEAGLLRQILQKIADNSGFLVEERLKELLAPYSERERTLIRIDNVFSALNVHSGKDMDLLMTSFLPYCYCSVCESQDQIALTETEITTYDNSLSRESSEMCVEQMDSGSNTTAATAPVANITTSVHFNENTHAISSQRTIGAKDSCRAANHPLSIDHAYVLKALKDFAAKFYETRFGISLASSLDRKHSTVSRLLTDEDVFMYWSRFLELFDTRHEKLWDGLYLGLKKYQEVLEDRHKLNQQTELLKVQNCELRRLLHTYMMTGSKKTQKPDREFVPPHARRRMVTHMLLFDEP